MKGNPMAPQHVHFPSNVPQQLLFFGIIKVNYNKL